MAAPKKPNVTSAAAARLRIGDRTAAIRLHAAGWFLVAPDRADAVRSIVQNSGSSDEDWGAAEWTPGQEGQS